MSTTTLLMVAPSAGSMSYVCLLSRVTSSCTSTGMTCHVSRSAVCAAVLQEVLGRLASLEGGKEREGGRVLFQAANITASSP